MSGPKRNADKLNTIGIVVVGICGAVLVYVTIVALQAFYAGDTSEVQTMADYGGNDEAVRTLRVGQVTTITTYAPNGAVSEPAYQTYRIKIDEAMKQVVQNANPKNVCPDFSTCGAPGQPVCAPCASNLIPLVAPSTKASAKAVFGRPQPIAGAAGSAAAPAPVVNEGAGSGSAGAPPPPTAGSAAAPAAGSGAVTPPPAPPTVQKTGVGTPPPGAGSGATTQPKPATGSAATPTPAPKTTPPAAGSGSAKGNGR